MTVTVGIVGSGTTRDPYQPDFDGDYNNATYDFENGTVTIEER